MTGAAIESLQELLRALGHERSLRGRLRVLGHSWQLLRSLSPSDREKVALRLGSSWAWKRLEKSFLADGELSETERTIGRVFERMGAADPRELRDLASSIRSGDRRAGKDLLLMTLTEALEEEADDEAALEAVTLDAEPSATDALPDFPEPAEASGKHAEIEAARANEPAPRPRAAHPAAPSRERGVTEAAPSPSAPSPAPPPSPSPPRPTALASTSTPTVGVPPRKPEASETFSEFGERPVTSGAERLQVLRALHRDARPGGELGRSGRARLLESLGGGWAARRALSRMIAEHTVEDLDEALALVAQLGRSGQRTWCLSDLIEHWALDDDSEQRILAAAPSDAARRRLAHRLS